MDTSILEREAINWDTSRDFPPLQADLAREVKEHLGYRNLSTEVHRAKRRELVRRKMEELDIRPFTSQSVEAYKHAGTMAPSWTSSTIPVLIEALVGISVFGLLGGLGTMFVTSFLQNATLSFYASCSVAGSCFVLISSCFFDREIVVERKWILYDLKKYTEPIPEFALHTALELKKVDPKLKFLVCALEERRVVIDPFLVMRVYDGKDFHDYSLEVWNEPTFHGEREA